MPHVSTAQKFLWANGIGGHVNDVVSGTTTDKEGNVYVTGAASFESYGIQNAGLYIAKFSPTGALIWVRNNYDTDAQSNEILIDSQENIYVIGTYELSFTLESTYLPMSASGQPRLFVLKYNSEGNLLWARHFASRSDGPMIFGEDMAIDQYDNLYITGRFTGTIDFDQFSVSATPYPDLFFKKSDIYIVKLTSAGQVSWAKSAGGPDDDLVTNITIDTLSNALYLSGTLEALPRILGPGKAYFDHITLELNNNSAIVPVIARYDYAGNSQWAILITGAGANIGDLISDKKGGFYASGTIEVRDYYFGNQLVKGIYNGREKNNFVVRFNEQGAVTWVKQFGFKDNIFGYYYHSTLRPITIDPEGNFYLAGPFSESIQIDTFFLKGIPSPSSGYNTDVFVAKFNQLGQAQWVKMIGGQDTELPSKIALDSQNKIIISGHYTSTRLAFDNDTITNNSGNRNEDVFVAKLSNPDPIVCLPMTISITAPNEFCEGDSVQLSAKAAHAYTYQWLKDKKPINAANDSTFFTTTGGVFRLVFNPFTSCADTSEAIVISRIDKPNTTLTLNADSILCQGEQLTLSVSTNLTYTYQWYKDRQLLLGQTRPILHIGEAGAYFVQITNQARCQLNSKVQHVVVVPKQENFLPDTIYTCVQKPEKIAPSLNNFQGTFFWSNGETSEVINPQRPGRYTLQLQQRDCVYMDTVDVVEYEALIIPNVFTPNEDQINDYFFIKNLLPNCSLEIYNRFGKLVYHSQQYQNNWEAENVTSGLYFYFLRTIHPCAQPNVAKGWVQVLR